jgi:hypothetical protein
LAVLTSRLTFSAAMQLIVELEQDTQAVFVGEPTGGSPNQYGDATKVELPNSGLDAWVATVAWKTAGDSDDRVTRTPDIRVRQPRRRSSPEPTLCSTQPWRPSLDVALTRAHSGSERRRSRPRG